MARPPASATFVFAHGLFGFDEIRLPIQPIRYFRGVAEEMTRLGVTAIFPEVSSRTGVEDRAGDLAKQIAGLAGDELVLVGNSMGGLNARYLTAHLDPAARVRAVVTVGTPHRGSPMADDTLATGGPRGWLGRLFFDTSIGALTGEACRAFNATVADREDVIYLSFAAARPVPELSVHLRTAGKLIAEREGDNDGLVSVASAQWGQGHETLRADHMELIGWSFGLPDARAERPFDHLALYRRIVTEVTNQ